MNAEVMPGQWEYQIGYRGVEGEDAGALNAADHTWFARWLIHRLSESITFIFLMTISQLRAIGMELACILISQLKI